MKGRVEESRTETLDTYGELTCKSIEKTFTRSKPLKELVLFVGKADMTVPKERQDKVPVLDF